MYHVDSGYTQDVGLLLRVRLFNPLDDELRIKDEGDCAILEALEQAKKPAQVTIVYEFVHGARIVPVLESLNRRVRNTWNGKDNGEEDEARGRDQFQVGKNSF